MCYTRKGGFMKRLIIYRILTLLLVFTLIFSFHEYQNKNCVVNKITKKEIVNQNYLFLGDSIIDFYNLEKYYKDLPVVNSGKNGNRVHDILDDMNNRVYRYNPSKVILLIGINDLLYDNNDDVYKDIEKLTKEINQKLPTCKIYIQSIYPINNKWKNEYYPSVPDANEMREKIENVNNKIKEICKKNNYIYIDLYSHLLNEDKVLDEKFSDDGLHPNDEGYKIITNIVKKSILRG